MAVDAMEKHLYDMLKGAGYTQIQLGLLYADKSTVDTHYDAVKNNKAVYDCDELVVKVFNGAKPAADILNEALKACMEAYG